MGDRLEAADRTAKLLARLGVVEREVDRRLGGAAISRRRAYPLHLQAGQEAVPALVLTADQTIGRHACVIEEDLIGSSAAPAEHIELAQLHAGRRVVDEE